MIRSAIPDDIPFILCNEQKYFTYPRLSIDYTDFLIDEKMRGYADMKIVIDEGYIGNVLVLPEFRRQGIGDNLIEALINKAKESNLAFATLEVRVSNLGAISLYKKHRFEIVATSKNHFTCPKEDAYIMTIRSPF